MIISASKRTDIPTYYSKWFVKRLQEGYVLIQNPYNKNRYSKAILTREAVDCIVFWTKNPQPMISNLSAIDDMGYPYYFQFTLTPYKKEIEKGIPSKKELLSTFQKLSERIGSNRIVWRYDPIIINDEISISYHINAFKVMAKLLRGYTHRCIISFCDNYKSISKRLGFEIQYQLGKEDIYSIAQAFAQIAAENDMKIFTCAEPWELSTFGIAHAACIDKKMIEEILGKEIDSVKDKNPRPACGCIESIDIGTYDCCSNGCCYCYAIGTETSAKKNISLHNPLSPLLIGEIDLKAIVTQRESRSIIEKQQSLF